MTGLLALALIAGSASLVPEGRPAPALEGQTLEGRPWADRLTGEITIVEFFATWCPKCRQSLGDTHRLAAARQVRLIIVDVDEDPALVQAFFSQHPPPPSAGVLVDQSGRARANWGVTGFPSLFVIDKAGIVRERFAGWDEPARAGRGGRRAEQARRAGDRQRGRRRPEAARRRAAAARQGGGAAARPRAEPGRARAAARRRSDPVSVLERSQRLIAVIAGLVTVAGWVYATSRHGSHRLWPTGLTRSAGAPS